MGPGDLSRALAPLPRDADPRIVVGRETYDDAGVFALSDVYAMGGEPLTALNIVGFPAGKLPLDALSDILRGGHDKVHEAGAVLIGGHTVIDDEVKYGLAVTGRADPRRLLTNAAARPGDVLVLTKPIGTGLLATAAKRGDDVGDAM